MGLFGTSGIRRIADRNLLEIALRTGLALGRMHRTVVVARDTRSSGSALKHALISGLLSAGSECYDAGLVPTPTLAFATRHFDAGVMITASHNPPNYNGLKIFNPDGSSYVSGQQVELERMLAGPLPTASWQEIEEDCLTFQDAVDEHVEHIMEQVSLPKGLRVVVDCDCGAASVITPLLLRKMGCEVVSLNSHPSAFFPHDAEPTAENLVDLCAVCRELNAVGIAHDGDADRMMAVDEKGRFIPGDKLLILLARSLQAKQVVTTVDASMVIEEVGLTTVRTRVGDTYVSEALIAGGDFGGEPSGAWVFPKNSLCPDGIYAAAALALIASCDSLSALADGLPQYPIIRGSVPGDGLTMDIDSLKLKIQPIEVSNIDGWKFTLDDGWVLVRPSGTEPKIRITAEAQTEARAHQLFDITVKTLRPGRHSGGHSG
jgi:phosphoglucosamine mutase